MRERRPCRGPWRGYSAYGVTLSAPGLGAGQGVGGAGRGDDDVVGGRVDRPEEGHRRARGEPDAGHPAGRATLRPHGRGGEAEQLGVAGDEDEVLGAVVQRGGADDGVAVAQRDGLPVGAAGVVGGDPLDDALSGAQRDARARRRRAARSSAAPRRRAGRRRRPAARRRTGSASRPAAAGSAARAPTSAPSGPREVTSANSPRAVVRTAPMTASCLARPPSLGTGSAVEVRASRPVDESSTQHGSSVTSSGVATEAGRAGRLEQHGAAGGAVRLGDVGELGGDGAVQQLLVGEDRLELLDLAQQLVALGLELDAREPGEAAQLQLEDVVGLGLGQVEDRDQPGLGHRGVVGAADQLDDLVDVEDRDEQPLDEVQPFAGACAAGTRCAAAPPRCGTST